MALLNKVNENMPIKKDCEIVTAENKIDVVDVEICDWYS